MRILICFIILSNTGCRKHSIRFNKSASEKEAKTFISKYGTVRNFNDTIIKRKKISFIYRGGNLEEAGTIWKGQKIGKWYYFASTNKIVLSSIWMHENDSVSNMLVIYNIDF